jgi:hypothetical protein
MKSKSETGHAKNIANANLLNTHIIALGATYNPSNSDLALPILQSIYTNAYAQQETVNDSLAPYSLAVDNREMLFATISKKVTKLRRVYKSTKGVNAQQLEDFTTIANKLRGTRKSTATATTLPETPQTQHSTSQMSYDQRTNNLGLLISLFQNTPNYGPNEVEYQITTLQAERAQMLQSTQSVADTFVPLNSARNERNKAVYNNPDNLVDTYNNAKNYLFTILDVNSTLYKAIAKIKFRRP